jgi:acyl carrier protein
MTIETSVTEAFREALDLPPDVDVTTLTYRGHPSWSSLGHMALVAALEDKFDIMMDSDDILNMSDFHKAVDIMRKYNGPN